MFPLKAATFLFVIALFFGVVSMERGVDEQTGHAWVKFSVSDHGLEKARGLLLQLADVVQAMRESLDTSEGLTDHEVFAMSVRMTKAMSRAGNA